MWQNLAPSKSVAHFDICNGDSYFLCITLPLLLYYGDPFFSFLQSFVVVPSRWSGRPLYLLGSTVDIPFYLVLALLDALSDHARCHRNLLL